MANKKVSAYGHQQRENNLFYIHTTLNGFRFFWITHHQIALNVFTIPTTLSFLLLTTYYNTSLINYLLINKFVHDVTIKFEEYIHVAINSEIEI